MKTHKKMSIKIMNLTNADFLKSVFVLFSRKRSMKIKRIVIESTHKMWQNSILFNLGCKHLLAQIKR